ncbi:hypothetical protein T484DRAFT_1764448 [Baffinella frigidus]|nr:hypothetical protein T484DRAFT_1764448 [Cryptophyta sp. CCMP2293]
MLDKVTVRYRSSPNKESLPFVVFIHFRDDLTEDEMTDASGHVTLWDHLRTHGKAPLFSKSEKGVHGTLREHLRTHGKAFPFRTSDKVELSSLLGHHGSLDSSVCLESSWEDIRVASLSLVESLEVFLGSSDALDAGLEVIDAPAVKEADIADGIVFVLNADEPLDWWPIRHALQYFPPGGVFVVCVSDGTEDSAALSEARASQTGTEDSVALSEARAAGAELRIRLHCLPGTRG